MGKGWKFWTEFTKRATVKGTDKVLIGNSDTGETMYADVDQIKGGTINDEVTSTASTWSSEKIDGRLDDVEAAVESEESARIAADNALQSGKADKTYVDSKDANLQSQITTNTNALPGKEDVANKRNDLSNPNSTTYPTTKAVADAIGEVDTDITNITNEITTITQEITNIQQTAEVKTEYRLTGPQDGSNNRFSTVHEFVAGSTKLYLNGVRQFAGVGKDYIEDNDTQVLLAVPPAVDDNLTIDYIKKQED